ncbi:MAG TPA: hypothetical protein VD993_18115 [Chitinophagaceae bacterium]|nr:hypothetical protein [Chitinophagaceae bacterium]
MPFSIHNPTAEPPYTLFWGTVTRNGNEITVRDEIKEMTVMHVILNNNGLPATSDFHNRTNNSQGHYRKDITQYYYTGTRLDSIRMRSEMNIHGL